MRTAVFFFAACLQSVVWCTASSQESEILEAAIKALPLDGPVFVHPRALRLSKEGRPFLGQTESDFGDRPSPAIAELIAESEGIAFCQLTAKGACALRRPGAVVSLDPVSAPRTGVRELFVSVVSGGDEGAFTGVVYRVVLSREGGGWLVTERERTYAYTLAGVGAP